MPIPSTNITFTNIQTELGGTNPISLSEYYNVSGKFGFGITGIPTSGQININIFKGKSKGINVSITGTGNNFFIMTNNNSNYKYALFTSNGNFTIDKNLICDILVVGGGGGGGSGGGGGGAGAVLYTTNFNLSSGSYSIIVGNGGTGSSSSASNGSNGNDSSITINSITYTATGGGGGGTRFDGPSLMGRAGNNGGSGGGGSHSDYSTSINIGGVSNKNNYTNWISLGNSGGDGKDGASDGYGSGGGGGAGSIGSNAGTNSGGNGGTGINLSSIFGTNVGHSGWFGGGGGGGSWTGRSGQVGYGNGGNGLLGGGGNAYGGNGIANTGGGGGGGDFFYLGGTGGSGVVIIRYTINYLATITTTNNNYVLLNNSSLLFNYTNYSNINSGTYNIIFLNGSITINSTPSINDKSYPILKDNLGNTINPTAWYKFDDSTNIGLDSSSNGYHLTNNGNVSIDNINYIKGTSGCLFNGGNNLQRAYTNNLFSDQAGWSLSFWVYLKKPADLVSLISTRQSDSSTLRGFNWYYNNVGEFGFQIGNDLSYTWYGFTYVNFYTDNVNFKWFHLVLTIKSGEQRLYSNGILIGSYSIAEIPNFQNGSSAFTIGSSSMNTYYVENGFRYDDVRYYGGGRILTQSQVTELYNGRVDIYTN